MAIRLPLLGLALVLASTAALARQAADPAASPSLGGSAVPGICMLSQPAVLANSKVGVAADQRLKQITAQAQAEINAERQAIEADGAKLKSGEADQRRTALVARARALQERAALRAREIEATKQKVLGRISVAAQPVIAQAYKSHNCGLLIERSTVLGGNMSGDLTAEVVRGLDAKLTTITFERESLSPQVSR
jgi:Skp family chaperone for outer membrane proteins